jgi:hypothetical protein
MALILLVTSLATPRITARLSVNRTVALGMVSLGCGMLLLSRLGLQTDYWFIICCFVPFSCGMAFAMSPSTAAIMSAVPARRAGMGSAMNDATRELGAALGVAVLGSIAASRYSTLIAPAVADLHGHDQQAASSSIGGALDVAAGLTRSAGDALASAAQESFLSGLHLAVLAAAGLAFVSATIVYRYLPATLRPEGSLHGPVESLEDAAELGLGGTPPIFGSEQDSLR